MRLATHLADHPWQPHPLNTPPAVLDAGAGRVDWGGRTKVCIYGAGEGRGEAPLDDPDWVVWALNVIPPFVHRREGGPPLLRCDAWFELHEMKAQSLDDLRWMAKCPVPLYVVPQAMDEAGHVHTPLVTVDGKHPATQGGDGIGLPVDARVGDCLLPVPQPVRFPLADLEARYGSYWACTFAYQLALALREGFTEVGLYGVELAKGTLRERTVEWACTSWWAGYLEASGVKFHLPVNSSLGRHPHRYGIEYTEEIDAVKRYTERWTRVERLQDVVGMGG